MTRHDIYVEITKEVLRQVHDEEAILACMVILHTHDFVLAAGIMPTDMAQSAAAGCKLLSVTRRHAAEVVSEALGSAQDQGVIDYWYARYSSDTPYEVIESVPPPLSNRVVICKEMMLKSSLLKEILDSN